jgi:RHS repeat-associated protein
MKYIRYISVALLTLLLSVSTQGQSSNTDGSTPLGIAPGAPAGSYSLTDFESVNLFNGHLNFRLSLMTVGGRGGAQAMMFLPIEQTWRIQHTDIPLPGGGVRTIYVPLPNWWRSIKSGYGAGVLEGRRSGDGLQECILAGTSPVPLFANSLTRLTFSAPDGTEFELRDKLTGGQPKPVNIVSNTCPPDTNASIRGREFVTADGTSATFVSDTDIYDHNGFNGSSSNITPSGYLMLRDGMRYRIDGGLVSWMLDRNGNRLSFSYDSNRNLTAITDSLNRLVTIERDVQDSAPFGLCDRITYKGSGAMNRIIRVSRSSLSSALRPNSGYSIQTLEQLFPETNIPGTPAMFNPNVISQVWLPDGRSYKLYYNPYAELARVELPTGGAIEYDYAAGVIGEPTSGFVSGATPDGTSVEAVYRRLTERRVYSNGTTLERKTTYSRPESFNGQYQNQGYVEVDSRDSANTLLTRSRQYFYGSARGSLFQGNTSYPAWKDSREFQTDSFDSNGTTLIQRVSIEWEQREPVSWWTGSADLAPPNDPRVKSTTTTLAITNQVSKKTFNYDQYNNQTEVYEYGFGTGSPGSLLRHTQTVYLTNNPYQGNINYATDLNIHIRNLPTFVQVFDGNSTELSRTNLDYDRYELYGLQDCPNIVQHDGGFHTDYGTRGNIVKYLRWLLPSTGDPTEVVNYSQYDIAGNVVKTIDGRTTAGITTFDFSDRFGLPNNEAQSNTAPPELGGLGSYAFPTKVTNALGHTTYTQYDYYSGKPVDSEDPNGVDTSVFYNDALERTTQVVRSANIASAKSQTTFAYNDAARTITTTSDRDNYGDNLLKSEVVNDGLGRTIESRQYESGSSYISVNTVYDAMGRALQVSNPYRSGDLLLWTTTQYDALSRVTRVTTPDGAQVNTQYNGNQVTVTDQAGKKRRSETDALGRLLKLTEDPGGLNYETNYQYDALDNLRVVQQGAQTRTFTYDSLSRLTAATNPESGTVTYKYDENGNLTEKTDARNITTKYTYDALNRNTSVDYSNTSINPDITRFYDKPDAGTYGKGRFWHDYAGGDWASPDPTNIDHTAIDSYDPLGRPLTKRQLFKRNGVVSPTYSISQTYDLAGNVKKLTYPSGLITANYSYDQAGRLTADTLSIFGVGTYTGSDSIEYNAAGQMIKERFGTRTPLYHKMRYNNRLQLGDVRLSTDSDDALSRDRGALLFYYGPDAVETSDPLANDSTNNGNMVRQEHYVPLAAGGEVIPQADNYSYDALNRISSAVEPNVFTQNYGYDRWGNRRITSATGGINNYNPTYDAASNRIMSLGYDAAGNITSDPLTGGTMTYDAENHLLTAAAGGGASYTYNADGKRTRRIVGGQETWYVYGIGGELLVEYGAAAAPSAPQKVYGYRNGQLLVVADASETGDRRVQWLVQDHLGSTRMVVDGSGSLEGIRRHDYIPFGEELGIGVGIRSASIGYGPDSVRQKYTGKQRDDETGLDFSEARYFSSTQGRFTSVDPLMASASVYEPQSWNRYAYVQNNPCKHIDPTGLKEISAEDCQKDNRCVSVKVNVIYDANANKGQGLTDKQKAQFEKTQLQKAKDEYGDAKIRLEVTYTEGRFDSSKGRIVGGISADAINVLVTTQNLGTAAEAASQVRNGIAATAIDISRAGEGVLGHEFAHHFLGHTTSSIGNAMSDYGGLIGNMIANTYGEVYVGRARFGLALLGSQGGQPVKWYPPNEPPRLGGTASDFNQGARSIQQFLTSQKAIRPRQ